MSYFLLSTSNLGLTWEMNPGVCGERPATTRQVSVKQFPYHCSSYLTESIVCARYKDNLVRSVNAAYRNISVFCDSHAKCMAKCSL